jgi:putative transposase
MRYQFIENHRVEFPVSLMCRVLAVSPSGYYAWRKRPPSRREMADQLLFEAIRAAYEANHGIYGSTRIYQEVKDQVACSEKRVARLMKEDGLRAKQTWRHKRTTKANPAHPAAPNLLAGDFEATQPDRKWTADITYIDTVEGWLYLAVVLDLFSRRVVGWAMSARMTSDLVITALQMAIQRRQPAAELLHHSDRGSQYTGLPYQQMLSRYQF